MNAKKIAEELCNASPCTITQRDARDDYIDLIERALIAARDEALSEAAKVCDKEVAEAKRAAESAGHSGMHVPESAALAAALCVRFCAESIRALKTGGK